MRECPRCGSRRSEDAFYPDAAWRPTAWCKLCINEKRSRATASAVADSDKRLREQHAICAVLDSYQQNGEPYVYLLDHGHAYKIGFSTSVSQRVRSLNTAHSKPVKVVAVAPGGRRVEAQLHARFKHCRIAREWYGRRPVVLQAFQAIPGSMVFLPGLTRGAPAS